jgi:hypothetical protein
MIHAVGTDQTVEMDHGAYDGEFRPETTDKLKGELARLSELSVEELQSRWRKLFCAQAPAHLPRYLLLRIISYRMQADALGDLDRASLRYLQQIAQSRAKRLSDPSGRKRKAPPSVPPVTDSRSLKPGTVLVREHAGQLHKVVVKKDGFSWNETSYRSLSEAAQAITGTKWNGPRFFGLRDKNASKAESQQAGVASR